MYHIRYQVNDVPSTGLSLSCSNEIVVSVIDVNEAPVVRGGTPLSVAEMSAVGTVVGVVDAYDEDVGDVISYELLNAAASPFKLDAASGTLTVADAGTINFEVTPSLFVQVAVTDRQGLRTLATLTVTVLNVNDPPVLQSAHFTANECALSRMSGINSRHLELLGAIQCYDEDVGNELAFTMVNDTAAFVVERKSGLLYAETTLLDFETKRAYDLSIQCSDGVANSTTIVSVDVVNINEAPTILDKVLRVNENIPAGTSLGYLNTIDPEYDDENF